ncbi:TAXI family TRAP transporter solute-binding subunit [Candidatus Poribacteria bacterium]|nr:TAXI family TRAP transporter solute-binding subunit [Candidatus Poribacteria bacterium]
MNARTWVIVGVTVLILIFAGVSYKRFASPLPHRMTIASGSSVGMYHKLAQGLKKLIEQENPSITVEIRPTNGSAENLTLIQQRGVDFAFYQNSGQTHPNVRTVANLYLEVLHIVAHKNVAIQKILDLQGKRVSVGVEGSGTYQIAQEVLTHYNMKLNGLRMRTLDFSETVAALQNGEIDAAFAVTGVLSPALTDLLRTGDYALVPINEAEAIAFKDTALLPFQIPRTAYSGNPPVPAQDTQCIAVKASLITHERAPAFLVRTVTQAVLSLPFRKQMLLRELTETFAQEEGDFPIHRGALDFYDQGKPTFSSSVAEAFDDALPYLLIVAILFIVIGAALRQNIVEKHRLMHDRLHELMLRVSDIEEDQRGETDVHQLFRLLDLLSRIKKRAVEDRVHGRLPAGDEYVGFMIQLDGLINTIHSKLTVLTDRGTDSKAAEQVEL